MGKKPAAMAPSRMMTIEMTHARTGRSMKKRASMNDLSFRIQVQVSPNSHDLVILFPIRNCPSRIRAQLSEHSHGARKEPARRAVGQARRGRQDAGPDP